jgi:polysaccharide export outer membrane protein
MRTLIVIVGAVLTAACASDSQSVSTLPTGAAAYSMMPAVSASKASLADYRIGPLDLLDVTVFQEPELSPKKLQVDAAGRIALPLVGSVEAKGKTPAELSAELEQLLGARYLRDPQVTVTIASSVSQKVSVQGEVAEPGVYQLTGPTTLLDVISLAKGETELASLKQVVVFRNINGQRSGAVFDINSIRRGLAADPKIEGNDLVVVGHSAARKFWKDVVSAAPMLNVFRPIVY